MQYVAIFDIPDDHVIYKGQPAMIFSHDENSEVITISIAKEVFSVDTRKGGLYDN